MKTLASGIAALVVLFATEAFAADMAVKMPLKAAPPACSWCGWYVGLNAGWVGTGNSFGNTGTDTGTGGVGSLITLGALPTSMSDPLSGFLGGAQIGYNWQTGNVVYGLEADFDGASAKKSSAVNGLVFGTLVPTSLTVTHQLDWLSTVRGRIGALVAPNFLLYATGGVAVGEVKTGNTFICLTCGPSTATEPTTSVSSTNTRAGGTVGAGAEWMVAPHWSLKAEYLYANLGHTSSTVTYTYGAVAISTLTSAVRNGYNIARAGVNWHF